MKRFALLIVLPFWYFIIINSTGVITYSPNFANDTQCEFGLYVAQSAIVNDANPPPNIENWFSACFNSTVRPVPVL